MVRVVLLNPFMATCHSHLGVASCAITMSTSMSVGKLSVFLTSKALERSFLAISFRVIFLSYPQCNFFQALSKPNQTLMHCLSTCEYECSQRTYSYEKSASKNLHFSCGCTVRLTSFVGY